MAEKVVSFIVPAYNSEAYLEKCLRSFCNPKVLNQLEVLIVNDGSTDGTCEIGIKYVKKYPKSFILINKINGGHGSAINTGVKEAKGKYIKVIDSDDWVLVDSLPEYISALERLDADVILTNYYTVDISSKKKTAYKLMSAQYGKPMELEWFTKNWSLVKNVFTFHGITYRCDFYKQWNHLLPEHIFYEDHEYSTIPSCFSKKIVPLDIWLYVYQIGNRNQSVASLNQLKKVTHLETVIHHMVNAYQKYCCFLDTAGVRFYILKLKIVVLGYYRIACIVEPCKRKGRHLAKEQNNFLYRKLPLLQKELQIKYFVFLILNYLHISEKTYSRLLNCSLYRFIR